MKKHTASALLFVAGICSQSEAQTIKHRPAAVRANSKPATAVHPIPLIAAQVLLDGQTITTIHFPATSSCAVRQDAFVDEAGTKPSNADWTVGLCDGSPQYFIGTNVEHFLKAVNAGKMTIDRGGKRIKLPPIALQKTYTITSDEEDRTFLVDHLYELTTAAAPYRAKFLGEPLPKVARASATAAPTARDILLVSDLANSDLRGMGLTDTPGVLIMNSDFGEIGREYRKVDDVKCNKLTTASYRCTYHFSSESQASNADSFAGGIYAAAFAAVGPTSVYATHDYVRENGSWTSPDLRAAIASDVQANIDAKKQSDKDRAETRDRDFKYDNCLAQNSGWCTY